MSRKLILTPYEHGLLFGAQLALNENAEKNKDAPIDFTHILLSAVTMAGVDSIHSIGKLDHTNSTLVKKVLTTTSAKKWSDCYGKVRNVFENYKIENQDEMVNREFSYVQHIVTNLLYAMKSNSGILLFADLNKLKTKEFMPVEIVLPLDILFSSIRTKDITLPVVRYDVEKKNIRKLIDVLNSKEFKIYKESQSEIDSSSHLTSKTVKSIEKAGKELYTKHIQLLYLKDSIMKTIPMSTKIIDLFFGKLPGILADYAGNILTDFLKISKTVPIYNCDGILSEVIKARIIKRITAANNGFGNMAG